MKQMVEVLECLQQAARRDIDPPARKECIRQAIELAEQLQEPETVDAAKRYGVRILLAADSGDYVELGEMREELLYQQAEMLMAVVVLAP